MLSSFDLYYKNLLEWNAVMNLTAITEEKDVFEKHFLDSLTITKIVSRETLDKGCTLHLWIWEPEPVFRDFPSL